MNPPYKPSNQRNPSEVIFRHLFVRLPCFCLGICLLCTRSSKHFSAFHSDVFVCAAEIRVKFNLLLKFRGVLKHTESGYRSSLACNQNIPQRRHSQSGGSFPFFEMKPRNETTNISSTKTSTQGASNIRGRTGYNV